MATISMLMIMYNLLSYFVVVWLQTKIKDFSYV